MCRIYGYCRISTMKQNIQRQIDNIKKVYPEAIIITETYTGTKVDRPRWSTLMKQVENNPDCLIVFDEVSRMSRDAESGYDLYMKLFDMGVSLQFLKEPHINTETYKKAMESAINIDVLSGNSAADKLISSVVDALNEFMRNKVKEDIRLAFESAQKEVDYLHQRTSEGVRRAQAEGKQVGRATGSTVETKKAKEMKERIRKMSKDFEGSMTDKEIIDTLGIARNSYYKYKKALTEM